MHPPALAFGVTAANRPDAARLGAAIEQLGYDELWANDTRRGDGLATLAAVAPGIRSLRLAVGVIALSEQTPAEIMGRLERASLHMERVTLGVGSGASASLDLVRRGVAELHAGLAGIPIAVAAVGPRMLHLAGEIADVVVMNWALPEHLGFARDRVAQGAEVVGRPMPRLAAYVRTAIGRGAEDRIRTEMERYRSFAGGHYARAFAAQPDAPVGVAVESGDPSELRAALAPYGEVVDTVVVRALPADDGVEAWLEVARAAASPLSASW